MYAGLSILLFSYNPQSSLVPSAEENNKNGYMVEIQLAGITETSKLHTVSLLVTVVLLLSTMFHRVPTLMLSFLGGGLWLRSVNSGQDLLLALCSGFNPNGAGGKRILVVGFEQGQPQRRQ